MKLQRVFYLLAILLILPLKSGFSQEKIPEIPLEEQVEGLKLKVFKDPSDVASQIELGRLYAKMKNYNDARKAFQDALQYDPQNAKAHFFLGAIYLKIQDDPDWKRKAVAEYQALAKLDAKMAGKLKEMMPANAFDSTEVQEIKQQMSSSTTDLQKQLQLARAYFKTGQKEEAQTLLSKMAAENPQSSEVFREMGKIKLSIGMIDPAREAYLKSIGADPGIEKSLCEREKLSGIPELLSSDTENIPDLKEMVGRFQSSLKDAVLNDLMLTDAKAEKKPSEVFSKGLRGSIDACMANLLEIGKHLQKAGKCKEARIILQRLVDAEVGMPDSLFTLGLVQETLGLLPEAIASFKGVIAKKSDDVQANLHLAIAYARTKQDNEAFDIFQKIVQDGFDPPLQKFFEANILLGRAFLENRKLASASAFLDESIKQKPESGKALILLGFVRVAEGNSEKASALFAKDRGVSDIPADLTFPQGYQVLGDYLFKAGKFLKAEKAYNKTIELNSSQPEPQKGAKDAKIIDNDRPVIFSKLGQALALQGKHPDAVEIFSRGLRLNPAAPLPAASASWFDFAAAAGFNGQDQRAQEIFEKVLPEIKKIEFSNYRKVNIVLSKVLRKLGREEEAMQALNASESVKVSSLNRKEGFENLYQQGTAFCLQKREKEATAAFKAALEMSTDLPPNDSPDVWICLGRILREKGKRRKALKCFQQVILLSPENPEAREGAVILTALLGDEKGCTQHLTFLRDHDPKRASEIIREINEMPALNDGHPFIPTGEDDWDGKLPLSGFSGLDKSLGHADFEKELEEKSASDTAE